VGFVMERCDRIAVLNLGEVVAVGSPREIQSDAGVRAAYLG
jgi:branched-chain amino acid transport system ATP-binding protein